jgi:alpha,alpha-trehalase
MTYRGLQLYGYDELSAQIKKNWLSNCEKVYAENGKMMEKYNVLDTSLKTGGGEYPNQDGFGWTNGIYIAMNEGS